MLKNETLALHTDLYQLNMMKSYFDLGKADKNAVFECYFRKLPFKSGYAIFAGLEHLISYLENLKFTKSDIEFLRETLAYPEDFLSYLENFKFKASLRSAIEGELVFANEPIIQVEGPLAHCQLIETVLLNIINYQTLIASKASRIKTILKEDKLLEFGSRRAQEIDAALWGTRAAYIGGCDATSNVLASKLFSIPIAGTHAHSFIQTFKSEYEAFKAYAESHKDCVFLLDTYDTLKSGLPNAIKVAQEMGDKINFLGVRIDSGDLAYLSKKIRLVLDEAGFTKAKIYASNDLDEDVILNLKMQGAKIEVWGVGTKLITAFSQPALGGVYKLVSLENDAGEMEDRIKISNNAEKVTTPGKKQVWRITGKEDKKSHGDFITLTDENPNDEESLTMFHPIHTYISKKVKNFEARAILQEIYDRGELKYKLPTLEEIKENARKNLASLWDEYKRTLNPQEYPVDLSQACWDNKMELIKKMKEKINKGKI